MLFLQIDDLWARLREALGHEVDAHGNTVGRWLLAVGVAILAFVVLRLVKAIVQRRVCRPAEGTATEVDNLVAGLVPGTRSLFLVIVALYVGSLFLALPEKLSDIIEAAAVIAMLVQGAIWGNVVVGFLITRYAKQRAEDAASVTTISALGFFAKLALWSLVLLLVLANLGFDVTALIAGLGIGGIAVALAAQNILGDLFASLSIVLDKPFVLGDFIIVGDLQGTVERIGIKTTRLRSLSGEQLVFPNGDLLQSRIRNYKRMRERRIVFTFGVVYQTPYEKLAAIPAMIRQAIEAQPQTRFDRAHFFRYGDSSLDFEVVYYMLVPEYNPYMDAQQAINLALFERFAREGIEFAYPTRTLFVVREGNGDGETRARGDAGPPTPGEGGERARG